MVIHVIQHAMFHIFVKKRGPLPCQRTIYLLKMRVSAESYANVCCLGYLHSTYKPWSNNCPPDLPSSVESVLHVTPRSLRRCTAIVENHMEKRMATEMETLGPCKGVFRDVMGYIGINNGSFNGQENVQHELESGATDLRYRDWG